MHVDKKPEFIFEKVPDFLSLLWYIPQEDRKTNPKERKELLGYMARHHEDLGKSFSDEQKETFEKFHDCWSEYMEPRRSGYI